MAGICEHQIRSARAILNFLLQTHGHCLDEKSLQTLMTETEAIINSRPLTVETMPVSPGLYCRRGGKEINISVMRFGVGRERNLSRP